MIKRFYTFQRHSMSAAEQDYGTPCPHRVEFHVDRLKAAAVGGSAILIAILIAYPPASRGALWGTPHDFGAAVIALTGATVLLAVGLFVLMRMLLWRGPVVVVDQQGIHDRRTGPIMTPWSCIDDIRVLDRYGHHIGIDTLAGATPTAITRIPWPFSCLHQRHAEPVTIIDTFFLRSITGSRILDFVMPLTAFTPIDLSETPVSEKTLAADADFVRNRTLSIFYFVIAVGLIPGIAAILTII